MPGVYASGDMFSVLGCIAGPRPRVHGGRRCARGRAGRAGRRHQPRLLAAALWRGGQRDRPASRGRSSPVHDHRRRARGLLRARRRRDRPISSCRSPTSAAARGNTQMIDGRSTWWLEVMGRLGPGQSLERGGPRAPAPAAGDSPGRDAAELAGEGSGDVPDRADAARRRGEWRVAAPHRPTPSRCRSSWRSWAPCSSSRAPTSRACCSRVRPRGAANSVCAWPSVRPAPASRDSCSPRA